MHRVRRLPLYLPLRRNQSYRPSRLSPRQPKGPLPRRPQSRNPQPRRLRESPHPLPILLLPHAPLLRRRTQGLQRLVPAQKRSPPQRPSRRPRALPAPSPNRQPIFWPPLGPPLPRKPRGAMRRPAPLPQRSLLPPPRQVPKRRPQPQRTPARVPSCLSRKCWRRCGLPQQRLPLHQVPPQPLRPRPRLPRPLLFPQWQSRCLPSRPRQRRGLRSRVLVGAGF